MTLLRDWLYRRLLKPSTADSSKLINVAKCDIEGQHELNMEELRLQDRELFRRHHERMVAMSLAFILALLMAVTTFSCDLRDQELAAVASSLFGGVSSVCGGILAVRNVRNCRPLLHPPPKNPEKAGD
jgi:hypothetical protein